MIREHTLIWTWERCSRITRTGILILYLALKIKSVFEQGKGYAWPRLPECPECGGKLWSHGYVTRYFEEEPGTVWMKRCRCCSCGAVHTLRPMGYYRRFQVLIAEMIRCLQVRIRTGKFWTLHGIKATAAILVSRFSEASKSSPQRLWRLTGVIGAPPFGVHYSDDPFVNVFCEKDLERYAPPFFCTDAIYEYQLTSMDIKAGG